MPISYNEYLRLLERRLYFNINELYCIIAKAIRLPYRDFILIIKLAKGGLYCIFEATFRDRLKAITYLLYLYIIPWKYSITSKVTTIKFLYIYSILVLKVLDWNLLASN